MNMRVKVSDDDIAQAQRESGWTETRTRVAFALFAGGLSDARVACLLGGVTRNAVIGKRNREGIYVGVGEAEADRPKVRSANTARHGETRTPRPPRLVKARIRDEVLPPHIDDAAIAPEQRRRLIDLTDSCCHWPVGDPGQPDFFYCGAVVVQQGERHRPYCPSHMRRAHESARGRRRTAETLVPRLSYARVNDDFRR